MTANPRYAPGGRLLGTGEAPAPMAPAPRQRPERTLRLPVALGALLLYFGGTLALTHDIFGAPPNSWIGHCCDPEQAIWYLRWGPYAISHLTNPFFTHLLNAPTGVNVMWNTPILFVSVLASPITLLFGPIAAYNIVLVAGITLGCWFAYFALRRYTRGFVAPLIGGAVYGFSPYVVPQAVLHLDLALAFFPPLLLLCLDELVVRRRRSPVLIGVALGLLAFAQLLTEEELLVTAALVGLVALVVLAVHRRDEIELLVRPFATALGVAAAVFLVLAAFPLMEQFFGSQRVHGPLQSPETFSTDLLNIVLPTSYQLFNPATADSVSNHFSGFAHEANAYLGLPLLVLLVAFIARRWRDMRVRVAAIAGLAALVLSMGPHLEIAGHDSKWLLPFRLLTPIPVLQDIQPNRVAVLMWLAIAVLVGMAIDSALSRHDWRQSAPRLALVALALIPVLPADLSTTSVPIPAFFQRLQHNGIRDGTTLLVAPFFRDGAGADPMLWGAVAGDSFAMPEAYAFIPINSRGDPNYGPPPDALNTIMQRIQDTGVVIVVRGFLRSVVADVLKADGFKDVVVGPMANRGQMVAFFTDLFGRPPAQIDGVQLWRDVDRAGVAPAS